jgi:hypothetical protein
MAQFGGCLSRQVALFDPAKDPTMKMDLLWRMGQI